MDIRAKANTSRTMRLFKTETLDDNSGQFIGSGKRLGFEIYTLSRILVIRKAWKEIAQHIADLDLTAPYPRFSRQSSYEEIRSKDWIFHEELGKLYEGNIKVSDHTYVSVEDPKRKGWWLSVMIDSNDFEDVRVTTYRPFKLEVGELIQDCDMRWEQPVNTNPVLRLREPIPLDWVGRQFNTKEHIAIFRHPKATVLPLVDLIS